MIFVGGNDSGKSSIFGILEIFFNQITPNKDCTAISISKENLDYLRPKYCESVHSAKRIEIEIIASDNRMLRGMTVGNPGVAKLILTIIGDGAKLELNYCHRGPKSDERAIKLYMKLKDKVSYVYVPSLRDVSSNVFQKNLNDLVERYIYDKVYPRNAGGTSAGYRQAKRAVQVFKQTFKDVANRDLLRFVKKNLSLPVLQDIAFDFDVDESHIMRWFLEKIKIMREARDVERISMYHFGTGVLDLPPKNRTTCN